MGATIPQDWRVGCAVVPEFELGVALRDRATVDPAAPIALIEERGTRSRVAVANRAALADGVWVGQSASRARAHCPGLVCLGWDPLRDAEAVRALAEQLEHAAPAVIPIEDAPGQFWFDARGMRLLGGESALAERLVQTAAAAGYRGLRVAIADAAVTARAAAQLEGGPPIQLVPPKHDQDYLGQLPLLALDVDADLRAALEALGFERVAQVRALPAAALEDRFGPAGREALLRALGHDARRPDGKTPRALPEVELPLDEPIAHSAPLIFGLRGMLDRLASRLFARGLSAVQLALVLRLDDHSEAQAVLEPARPLHHPRPLFELCRDRLERMAVDSPVVALEVKVLAAVPATAEQAHLGAARWSPEALEGALNRLQGRFERAVVFTAVARDAVCPEDTGHWAPVSQVPLDLRVPDLRAEAPPPAPVRRALAEPTPLTVRLDAQGQPRAVLRAGWCPVQAHGPERLSGGWWLAEPFAREDYRLVCTGGAARGQVLWVSKVGARWWLRGWLD